MKTIEIIVLLLGFAIALVMWPTAYSMAATATAVSPQADREYTPVQKQLIELGFQRPEESDQRIVVAQAQNDRASTLRERVNKGTVRLMAGGVNGTYIQVAADLASVLDDVEDLRILPLIGKGSVQNITDLLYLRGIDICIVQSDVLTYLQRQKTFRALNRRVHFITKLYNEEFHLLADRETETIQDLAGKKVNVGINGSGTHMTASTVFDTLEIEIDPTSFDQALALEKLKQGEIAAMVYVVGKPARLFQDMKAEGGIHFVPVPSTTPLLEHYLVSHLTTEDYPGLVPEGSKISTVAVGAVLAAFNWSPDTPRYQNVARFVDAFFSHFEEFQKAPRHEKWKEVKLTARIPGWTRFKAAGDWLKQNQKTPEEEMRALFMQFLSKGATESGTSPLTEEHKALLFREFMRWQSQSRAPSR